METNKTQITSYIGITIGETSTNDSGICILNRKDEIVRIDKAYTIDELTKCIENIAGKKNSIICIDMPEFYEMLEGKWRIENKQTQCMNLDFNFQGKNNWTSRYSDRGMDLCRNLEKQGLNIYRYCSNFTKTALNLHPYLRERTPSGCKFLQSSIKEKLGIKNLPNNMLPISVLDAILGAYTAKMIANGEENKDYCFNTQFKDFKIVSVK